MRQQRRNRRLVDGLAFVVFVLAAASARGAATELPVAAQAWSAHPSDGVEMHLADDGGALRIDFDFHGGAGYAIARQKVALDLPPNYQFVWRIRGEAPPENLEFKLIDESGENVWWLNRRDFVFPRDWTLLKTKKRQIAFAWGPAGGGELRHVAALEIVVTAGSGGKGTVRIDSLRLEPLPVVDASPLRFQTGTIDLGQTRELGGLVITPAAATHELSLSLDGERLQPVTAPLPDGTLFVWLPDTEGRRIAIEGIAVREVVVEPPEWAPSLNDFYALVAKRAPRGDYPRYLIGEQPYWTVVGSDGSNAEALVGEDGNIEPFEGGESIEPLLIVGGRRLTWADVEITHSLAEGSLPIPSVQWKTKGASLRITAAVSRSSMLQLRYEIEGDAELELRVRPFQVNPSSQFLNAAGGVARVRSDVLASVPRRTAARVTEIDIPLEAGAARAPFEAIAAEWREKLHRVTIEMPNAPRVADTIRTTLAYILIHRDGPALQPGSRSYARAWIRDGALMAPVLLRMGHAPVVREFLEWYAKFQFPTGKVPCCVDRRGADPVPENDSHGELIFTLAEYYRSTRDAAFVRAMWTHVDAAVRYIDELRAANHGRFEGLLTESISHEGYSAKPVHSHWDNFFALKGLEDAAFLAHEIGIDSYPYARDADRLRRSIARAIEASKAPYIPGSVELDDYDPSATAVAVAPLGLASLLPSARLTYTFRRYLGEDRRHRELYTPYEMRILGALVRRGDRRNALALMNEFLADQRPAAWNEWAEVVRRDARKLEFLGDMPHAWIAADFVRSALDAIAYDREDGTLVVGAGIAKQWLPLEVRGLPTVSGTIEVSIRGRTMELRGTAAPPHGIVVRSPFDQSERRIERLPATIRF